MSSGRPANASLRRAKESDMTMNNPPMTLRFLKFLGLDEAYQIGKGGAPEEEANVQDKTVTQCLTDDHS